MVISLDAEILPSSASRMMTLTRLFPIKMLHMSVLWIPMNVHVMVTTTGTGKVGVDATECNSDKVTVNE